MHRSLLVAGVALVGLVVAGAWWFTLGTDSAPTTPSAAGGGENAEAPDDGEFGAGEPARVVTSGFPGEEGARAQERTERPLLRVRAEWPDESPAADVVLLLRGTTRSQGYRVLARQVTDEGGVAVFENVAIGNWSVHSDRGDRKVVDYAGGEQELVFPLKGGVHVAGAVVDAANSPVAEASVWLQTGRTDWSSGHVVGKTDEQGRFELHHIPPTLSLGAFAEGRVPSALVDLDVVDTKSSPVRVRLELRGKGGDLVGTVVDTGGKAIADARIAVGKRPRHLDYHGDRIIEQWACRSVVSDAEGRFAVVGVRPGPLPVSVLHDGHGIWRGSCDIVAGETTNLRVEMQRAGTIRGVVTGADGQPVQRAVLRCFDGKPGTDFIAGGQIDFDETFGGITAASRTDGSFTLRNVTAGTTFVFAQRGGRVRMGESNPYAYAEIEVPPGSEVEWNPVVSDGRTIDGTVYFKDGHVMPNVFITLVDERSNKRHTSTNDPKGVFRFVNLDESTYTIRVQVWNAPKGSPPLQKSGIVPDQGHVEIYASFDKPVRKATGTVVGRIEDPGGRISKPKAARVVLISDARWFRDGGKIEHGGFRFNGVDPCRFRLALMEGKHVLAQSDWFELEPGQTLDTGALRTRPGGSVHIKLVRPAGTKELEPKLFLRRKDTPRSTEVAMGHDSQRTVGNLTPGDYEVTGWASGMVSLSGNVTVAESTTARLSLTLQSGVLCRFEAWFPAETNATSYSYTINRRDDGASFRTYQGSLSNRSTRPLPFAVRIPAGGYTVSFSAGDKLFARAEFEVGADQKEVRVRLDLSAR